MIMIIIIWDIGCHVKIIGIINRIPIIPKILQHSTEYLSYIDSFDVIRDFINKII